MSDTNVGPSERGGPPAPATVCGVRIDLIERFLLLIRDKFPLADKAAFFLEERAGITSAVGLANQRDVLSHLATMLDPSVPDDKREVQLINAEEHFRRAIIEPYMIALGDLRTKFKLTYEQYEREVLARRDKVEALRSAPSAEVIKQRLGHITGLADMGRAMKARNLWDSAWEEGVVSLVQAFADLSDLIAELDRYLYAAAQSADRPDRVAEHLRKWLKSRWARTAALLTAVSAVALTSVIVFHQFTILRSSAVATVSLVALVITALAVLFSVSRERQLRRRALAGAGVQVTEKEFFARLRTDLQARIR